jgi:hypothetical protein
MLNECLTTTIVLLELNDDSLFVNQFNDQILLQLFIFFIVYNII